MPELKLTNAKLVTLVAGLRTLIATDDMDVLFSFRLSSALELLEPKIKAYQRTREKLDAEYLTVSIKGEDGQTVGYRASDDKRHEYAAKIRTLEDAGVTLESCPRVKVSELRKMSEEEGIPVAGHILHALRPILDLDVDDAASAAPAGGKPKSRAERRRAARGTV